MAVIGVGRDSSEAEHVVGSTVYGSDNDKIGRAGQVYLDDETGRPEWVTVNTGLFGTNESFVPLREASMTGDGVTVPYTKDQVKDAPHVSPDAVHITPDDESALYRYYGLGGESTTSPKDREARPVDPSLKQWQDEMHALLDSAGELPSGV